MVGLVATSRPPGPFGGEHSTAASLAGRIGRVLNVLRDGQELEGKSLAAMGDVVSQEFLVAELDVRYPGDHIRSEEGPSSPGGSRLWVVDPLDGSREYGEGRDDWAVHVALVVDGAPVVGAVALPALDLVLSTLDPPTLKDEAATPPRIVVSRSRPPALATELAARLGATTIPMGSAGAKIAAVIRGEADIYVHAGGQYEWDSAAPVAVALVAGCNATRIDGSPLRYGRPDPWLPDLLVCHPSLAERALEALADLA